MTEETNADGRHQTSHWRVLGPMITLAGKRGDWPIFAALSKLLLAWSGLEG